MNRLTDKAWSPYAAGILIGLLQIPAFMLLGTALGASSSYVTVVATALSAVDPSVLQFDYAARHLSGAKNWWQVAMMFGVAGGAWLSARASGLLRDAPSPVWARVLGTPAQGTRFAVAFLGGFLLLLGARIADGCTSGHGISGMAQLAVGSTIAVAAMFAGGIATAFALRRI